MEEELKKYIQSIQKDLEAYKEKKLQTREYITCMEELNKWLEEQKNANSSN
jgi:hypothetical protein